MKKKSNRIFGIKTVDVNGLKVHTINIIINSSPIILNKVINDKFWKDNHTLDVRNGVSKINFRYNTIDINGISNAKESLFKILFAHKLQKVVNESYWINNKERIAWDVLAEIKDVNGGYL
jgi:hypothetical protein